MMTTGGNEHKFDPSKYEGLGLVEAFSEFVESFEFSYDALCREPPSSQATDAQRTYWRSQDKRKIFLGRFADRNLQKRYTNMTTEAERADMSFEDMVKKFKDQFKLNTNITLAHYKFKGLKQAPKESFDDFVLRVTEEVKGCEFKCYTVNQNGDKVVNQGCNVWEVMVRDQLIQGTSDQAIREKSLSKQWTYQEIINNGRTIEAANKGAEFIKIKQEPGRTTDVNKTR